MTEKKYCGHEDKATIHCIFAVLHRFLQASERSGCIIRSWGAYTFRIERCYQTIIQTPRLCAAVAKLHKHLLG